jgi:hypothetical protein
LDDLRLLRVILVPLRAALVADVVAEYRPARPPQNADLVRKKDDIL